MKLILSCKSLQLNLKWSLYPCGLVHFTIVQETQVIYLFIYFTLCCFQLTAVVFLLCLIPCRCEECCGLIYAKGKINNGMFLIQDCFKVGCTGHYIVSLSFPNSWQVIKRWRDKRAFGRNNLNSFLSSWCLLSDIQAWRLCPVDIKHCSLRWVFPWCVYDYWHLNRHTGDWTNDVKTVNSNSLS